MTGLFALLVCTSSISHSARINFRALRDAGASKLDIARRGGEQKQRELQTWLLAQKSTTNVDFVLIAAQPTDRWLLPIIEQIITRREPGFERTIAIDALWDTFPTDAITISKRAIAANSPFRIDLAIHLALSRSPAPEADAVLNQLCLDESRDQSSKPRWGFLPKFYGDDPKLKVVHVCPGSIAQSVGCSAAILSPASTPPVTTFQCSTFFTDPLAARWSLRFKGRPTNVPLP